MINRCDTVLNWRGPKKNVGRWYWLLKYIRNIGV